MSSHEAIDRPRLAAQADRIASARLTLVVGPAGSGKSALVDAWADALVGRAEIARLDLVFAHNDARAFRAALAASVAHALPALDWDPEGEPSPQDFPDFLAAAAAERRAHPERPLVVMFDDLQEIADTSVLGVIEGAIGALPGDVHLVVASRTPPPFLLGQLRAQGALHEVGAHDLALTPEELAALLSARGSELDPEDLLEETDGWLAGVVLALAQRRDPAIAVADYVDEEVLAGLPAESMEFLLDTAHLEAITPAAADALRESDDALRQLEALERRGRFPLRARDGSELWRHPAAVRSHLRTRGMRRDPDRYRTLRERARSQNGSSLSAREREVVILLDSDLSIAQIADALSISFHTAKSHVRSIYTKLGASTRTSAVRAARGAGLFGD